MSNFHATDADGRNFKSKKALREAYADDPTSVEFTDTGLKARGTVNGAQLSPSDVIVGPCPWTQRDWYANVKNGKVV